VSLIETHDEVVAPTRLTLYTTTWCGYCVRLKRDLARAGIDYDEIDVEADPAAAALVEYINGGYRTVPTALFPDGEAMTNPSAREVAAHLGGPG
jgi:mycoredoxin